MKLPTIRARTMIELKRKLREAMGWDDRRSWQQHELDAIKDAYEIVPDHRLNQLVAKPR